jgi:hypothetical protein
MECLVAIPTCEFHLNFLSFAAFEGQKADDCSLLHLAVLKRHVIVRRIDRYP